MYFDWHITLVIQPRTKNAQAHFRAAITLDRRDVSKMPLNPAFAKGLHVATQVVQIMFASHLFLSYGYELGASQGPSMLPTINQNGDHILVEKWTHLSARGYKVGDIVQGRHPYENHSICKRIVGKVLLRCRKEGND